VYLVLRAAMNKMERNKNVKESTRIAMVNISSMPPKYR